MRCVTARAVPDEAIAWDVASTIAKRRVVVVAGTGDRAGSVASGRTLLDGRPATAGEDAAAADATTGATGVAGASVRASARPVISAARTAARTVGSRSRRGRERRGTMA
jgi:hypothetical protein